MDGLTAPTCWGFVLEWGAHVASQMTALGSISVMETDVVSLWWSGVEQCSSIWGCFTPTVPCFWRTPHRCGIPGICLALAVCYYKFRPLRRHRPRTLGYFEPHFFFPPKRSKKIHHQWIYYGICDTGPSWRRRFVNYTACFLSPLTFHKSPV